jgi:hypothetical protein
LIIVDTTIWVDIFQGRANEFTTWLRVHMRDASVGLTDLTLCEVLQGIREDSLYLAVRNELRNFSVHSTGGEELAEAAAGHYRFLRKRGITPRNSVDCLIAAHCIREGHQLLHHDRDFDPFEKHLGLKVIHP